MKCIKDDYKVTSEQIIGTSQATGTVRILNLVSGLLPVCKSIRHQGAAEVLVLAYPGIFGQGSEIVPNVPGLWQQVVQFVAQL